MCLRIAVFFLILMSPLAIATNHTAFAAQQRAREVSLSVGKNEGTFLMLSDIHFDPFSGLNPRTFAQLKSHPVKDWQSIFQSAENQVVSSDGKDTNYSLLASAIDAAKNSGWQCDYVLMMGDYLAHNFSQQYRTYQPGGAGYQEFAVKTLVFVNRMIQQGFPHIPVYGALGNNDSTTDDYAAPGGALLEALDKEWKVISTNKKASKDFLAGGYYTIPHPTVPNSEFVVLNTAFLSERFVHPSSASEKDQALIQLKWLDLKLNQLTAEHKTATLIMHIPPGIDAFESSKPGECSMPTPLWKRPYLDSFLTIIGNHEDILRDSFAGHTHVDDFRVFTSATGDPFMQMHIAPSISREHHNNPAFEIGVYDKSNGALLDYAVTSLRNALNVSGEAAGPTWRLAYDFRQESRSQSYGPETLNFLAKVIRSNDVLRKRYMDFYKAQMSPSVTPIDMANWRFYSCAETEMSDAAFEECACPRSEANP